jgi:hypothetical protein
MYKSYNPTPSSHPRSSWSCTLRFFVVFRVWSGVVPPEWPWDPILGLLFFYPRNPVYARTLDPSVLAISLSLHRHPFTCILFSSRFTCYNKHNFLPYVPRGPDVSCLPKSRSSPMHFSSDTIPCVLTGSVPQWPPLLLSRWLRGVLCLMSLVDKLTQNP